MIIMLNIIKSASAIIRKSTGEVYLGLRSKNLRTFPNFWVFPGGKIDEHLNENWKGTEKEVIDTIIRELYEETSIVSKAFKTFNAVDAFDFDSSGKLRHHFVLVAVAFICLSFTHFFLFRLHFRLFGGITFDRHHVLFVGILFAAPHV